MLTLRDSVEKLFASGPPLPTFEHRPQQIIMAGMVADALENHRHLIVEAPTGIGKTLAYLLPALEYARRTGGRIIVSTHTRTLQEQLIRKDIPLAVAISGTPSTAAVLKGRRNYLCTS